MTCDRIKIIKRHASSSFASADLAARLAKPTRGRSSLAAQRMVTVVPERFLLPRNAFERWEQCDIPRAVRAKEADFKKYIEWRRVTTGRVFCNFQLHFCCRSGSKSNLPPNNVELGKALTSLNAIDIVDTVEHWEHWPPLAQSFLALRFEGVFLPTTRQNALAAGAPRVTRASHRGAAARSEKAITI